jgi:hypothetical protein
MEEHGIGEHDLLFPHSRLLAEYEAAQPPIQARSLADMAPDIGRTEPNGRGLTYRHGTTSGYVAGRCKCDWCRLAYAEYRAARRAEGKDRPAKGRHSRRGKNLTDHCPDDWFRLRIWLPALKAAAFSRRVVFYDLRHTPATWLANSHTVDIMKLKERMGHRSILTTQRYLSASEHVDHTAPDALEEYIATAQRRAATRRRRRIRAV